MLKGGPDQMQLCPYLKGTDDAFLSLTGQRPDAAIL